MSIKGLPDLDVPVYLRDPHDCRRCKHSFYTADDEDRRYLRCSRSEWQTQCRYERHVTGDCGEAALHFKQRGVE
jgi:hypothetical protein